MATRGNPNDNHSYIRGGEMPIEQGSADYFASELAKQNYERMKQAQDEGKFNTIKVPEVPCANCGANTLDLRLAGVAIEMDGLTFCCAACLEEWLDNEPQRQAAPGIR